MPEHIFLTLPRQLRTLVHLPASKSINNRALVLQYLATGTASGLQNPTFCDDAAALLRALDATKRGGEQTIDIGAAGTAMRFSAAVLALTEGHFRLTGSERMRQRPISVLVEALRSLGADVTYAENEGFPPLDIRGRKLHGGEVRLKASVSSQYISALLMIAPCLDGGLRFLLDGEVLSRPYIDMTCALMRHYGAEVAWQGANKLVVAAGHPYRAPKSFSVEGDWSAASYWYALVALCPDNDAEVILPTLQQNSLQGDSRVNRLFEPLGVATQATSEGIIIRKCAAEASILPGTLPPVDFNLADNPDLAQTLATTCAMLGRRFRFSGLRSLRIKETDRIAALQTELRKLGVAPSAEGDEILAWQGETCAPRSRISIDTYHDHRMAMAFAPCAYRFPRLQINEPGVVAKSYPNFWRHLREAGARIEA